MMIDAEGMHYRVLNEKINRAIEDGCRKICLEGVCGHRYIGAGLKGSGVKITVNGLPGNDLGVFMDGPEITVNDNVQDGVGNTLNSGRIIIHGNAGDILGHSMRGGEIFVKGSVGYRVGIHMKEYREFYPVIVIGGRAGKFLGEYMAGGMIILLGMDTGGEIAGDFIGTGMHGGVIYVRGRIKEYQMGKEVRVFSADEDDSGRIQAYVRRFCDYFSFPIWDIMKEEFFKILPITHRPYGKLYSY
jgi:glutamate synthase domain-containing protein 3